MKVIYLGNFCWWQSDLCFSKSPFYCVYLTPPLHLFTHRIDHLNFAKYNFYSCSCHKIQTNVTISLIFAYILPQSWCITLLWTFSPATSTSLTLLGFKHSSLICLCTTQCGSELDQNKTSKVFIKQNSSGNVTSEGLAKTCENGTEQTQ